MKTTVAAALLVGAAFTTGTAVAHADEVLVIGPQYATAEGCNTDAPNVHLAENDAKYPYWRCERHDDGFWYIYNSTTP